MTKIKRIPFRNYEPWVWGVRSKNFLHAELYGITKSKLGSPKLYVL